MNLPAVPARPLARPRSRRCGGFTLIELLVTVAVAAILLAVGTPSFLGALTRHAIQSQAEALQDAVRLGRNEAMKRSGPVILCRTESSAPDRCAGTSGNWQTWILFADLARSGAFSSNDPVIRAHAESSGRMTVTSDAADVRFEATGIAHADTGSGASFQLDPAGSRRGDRAVSRRVCVSSRGDVAIVPGGSTCP